MNDPYGVLGLAATASRTEVEARYRQLLRETHPDVHHAEGPEAVARAEARTRALNEAMALIRSGWHPDDVWSRAAGRAGAPGPRSAGTHGPWGASEPQRPPGTDASYWWNQVDDRPGPVACPMCGRSFDDLPDFRLHLTGAHRLRLQTVKSARPPDRGFWAVVGRFRFVPAWLVVTLALGMWLLLGFWFFVGTVALLIPVFWAQTSPRYKYSRGLVTGTGPTGTGPPA